MSDSSQPRTDATQQTLLLWQVCSPSARTSTSPSTPGSPDCDSGPPRHKTTFVDDPAMQTTLSLCDIIQLLLRTFSPSRHNTTFGDDSFFFVIANAFCMILNWVQCMRFVLMWKYEERTWSLLSNQVSVQNEKVRRASFIMKVMFLFNNAYSWGCV